MVLGCATLEYGFVLEGPRRLGRCDLPIRIRGQECDGVLKVRLVIGAKIQPRIALGPERDSVKELRLHESMLVMAFFRPGIGKEDKHVGKADMPREHFKKHLCFGLDEMKIAKLGAVALAHGTFDPFAGDIDTHTNCRRMGTRVGC